MNSKHKTYRKFIEDVGLIGIANVLNNFKSFLMIPIITKFLGSYNYGLLIQLKVTITLMIPVLLLGMEKGLTKFLAGTDEKGNIREDFFSCLFTTLFASMFIAGICFMFSGIISEWIFRSREYRFLIKLFALLIIFESANILLLEYFKVFRYMKKYFQLLAAETLLELGLVTLIIFKGYGIIAVVTVILITRFIFVLIKVIQVSLDVGFNFPKFRHLKKYVVFGAPLMISTLFTFIIHWNNRYIINYFFGLREVGIYSVSYFLAYVVTFIASPISYILFPVLAGCINRRENQEAAVYLKYSLKYFCVAGIMLIFGIYFCSKELYILFSTSEFLAARSYLLILLVGIFISQIGVIGEYVNIIFNKNMLIMKVYMLIAVISAVLNIILIPLMGSPGAALAMLISYMVYAIFNFVYSQRFIQFGIDIPTLTKIIVSAFFMFFILTVFKVMIPGINRIIFLPAGVFVYFISLYIMRCVTNKEILLFKSMLFRQKNIL